MDKHRLSLIVIGVLAVAIVFGGFFIGVQPQLDRSARASEQTESLRQTNDVQQERNVALAADNLNLGAYEQQLAAKQERIPPARAQQELINQIDAAAAGAGVTIRTLTFDAALGFSAPEGVTADAPAGGTLIGVPLNLTAEGDRANLEAFTANLQNSARIITIVTSQFTAGEESSLVISGVTWVLMPGS
ncbi:type 4a pilus biogenesis protein PilO [Microbacterium sp. zg-YB36]|uniref:type 4a pilus biogenesis protein PilO n=1 Tax=Microbacterium sp. zg-YB36 TaxID=2969407 RepID=UPI00214B46DC|nr:type 4a pilus biogenesis protein PilO [Microbacterium sp. zg-YB36]MDL5349968.1 type 4a pilus biogenesis protein PilO [Microbacterium sp. zg-YB36]